jgi:hypothetical protein
MLDVHCNLKIHIENAIRLESRSALEDPLRRITFHGPRHPSVFASSSKVYFTYLFLLSGNVERFPQTMAGGTLAIGP